MDRKTIVILVVLFFCLFISLGDNGTKQPFVEDFDDEVKVEETPPQPPSQPNGNMQAPPQPPQPPSQSNGNMQGPPNGNMKGPPNGNMKGPPNGNMQGPPNGNMKGPSNGNM